MKEPIYISFANKIARMIEDRIYKQTEINSVVAGKGAR